MNFNKTIMAASILAVASTVANEATGAEIISRPDFKVVDGKMTPELMEAFGRVPTHKFPPTRKRFSTTSSSSALRPTRATRNCGQ